MNWFEIGILTCAIVGAITIVFTIFMVTALLACGLMHRTFLMLESRWEEDYSWEDEILRRRNPRDEG